jgi:phosphoribosylamine--glycine ligase
MAKEPKVKLVEADVADVVAASVNSSITQPLGIVNPPIVDVAPAITTAPVKSDLDEKESVKEPPKETVNVGPTFSKKFLFVTEEALAIDLAWKLKQEGNEIKLYIGNEDDQDIGEGFVEKCDDWRVCVDWADVIIFDDVISGESGFGKIADELRAKGKLVIGGSAYTDRLETDREFGQQEMKNAGMLVLPHWDFDSFGDAIEFLKANPGRYIFKPSEGDLDWHVKNLLFIAQEEDGKDLLEVLEHNRKTWSRKIKRFQFQKVASGVEVAVGAFFNGNDFLTPINVNFEHKKLFPGDIGPATPEMGTLMFWEEPNGFFNATLGKMVEKLRASKYVGYIDINCIANARGIYPLEFTSRFGYPTISIHMEGIQNPMGEFLYALAKGEPYNLKTQKGFQLGVVIATPPFPYRDEKMFQVYKDASILFKRPNFDGIHLGDVKMVDNDWKMAGKSGYVLIVTGSGPTVETARRQAYRRIENIMLQNMFYRTDIGAKWFEESDELHTWGVL